MPLLSNQIRVLLQRVKMAGREPHKILMPQGVYEVLRNEIFDGVSRLNKDGLHSIDQATDAPRKYQALAFDGIPILVDNSVSEILVQVKPRPLSEDEPMPNIDWTKINKLRRL